MTQLFIFAGEASGDIHGAHIIEELLAKRPSLQLYGVGGPHMRALPFSSIEHMESFNVMGISDVLWALPRLARLFYRIRNAILKDNPAAVLLIDYPDFNMRLARSLRKKGYRGKIIQYVCPSIWAWRPNRKKHLVNNLDALLSIFPFEKELFAGSSLSVTFVGNPIADSVSAAMPSGDYPIALFPGSRLGEIERNLPAMLQALSQFPDRKFALSVAHENLRPTITQLCKQYQQEHIELVPPEETYALMTRAYAAIATCGTVALELGLRSVPTVVTYKLSSFNAFIARYILRLSLPFYCMTNILSKEEVFPELIHDDVTASNIGKALSPLISDTPQRHLCLEKCAALLPMLQSSISAPEAILEVLDA